MDTLHRKRPSSPTGSGPSQVKKRAIASSNGSPASILAADTSIESEREPQANNLELFRKEALFRRMRQHARERDRAENRIIELEHRKRLLEAAMGAVENCWNQILDQLQTVVKTNSLPIPGPSNIKDLLSLVELYPSDSDTPSEQFRNALLTDGQKTQDVIAAFVAMTPPPTPEYEELRARCQNAAAEATSLRTELHLVYSSFVEARSELEQYKELLGAVELRADRARTESIIAMEMSTRITVDEKSKAEEKISSKEDGGKSPLATQVNGKPTADIAMDEQMWRSQAEKREREIAQIVSEKLALRKRFDELQAQFSSRSEDLIRNHPVYMSLVEQISLLRERTQRAEEDRDAMQTEVKRACLEANQRVEEITAVMEAQTSEHEEAIKKKNKEIVRTKDQRESALKDLAVHKASDASKSRNWDSITARAHSLEDRVASLLLEVKRLKAQLAAKAGSEDLLSFLLETSGENLTFVQDLQNKVGASRTKISALEATIASLDQSHPDVARHLRGEAQAREECNQLGERVERYESIFGANMSADSHELVRLLRQKEDELQSLRLLQKQEQASSNDLFDELQRMSTAWEILDKQSKVKVEEAASWETKYNRVSVEKAKAEQKYFSAMREKEAVEAERKAAMRHTAKQGVLIAKLNENEKAFESQAASLKAETEMLGEKLMTYQKRVDELEGEVIQLRTSEESHKQMATKFKIAMDEAHADAEKKRQMHRKLDDEFAQFKKASEREIARVKQGSAVAGTATQREEALQTEVKQLMTILRCSTCNQDLKTHVLLKCMHTFCKSCIDARLTTRQRKCPACNLKFQDSDVQALYFQ